MLPTHLLLDRQGLLRSQDHQELLQCPPLDCFYLDFGVAAGNEAKGRSAAERGRAGWDGPTEDTNEGQSSLIPEQPRLPLLAACGWKVGSPADLLAHRAGLMQPERMAGGWGRAHRASSATPPRVLPSLPCQGALPCASLAAIDPLASHHIYSLTAFSVSVLGSPLVLLTCCQRAHLFKHPFAAFPGASISKRAWPPHTHTSHIKHSSPRTASRGPHPVCKTQAEPPGLDESNCSQFRQGQASLTMAPGTGCADASQTHL